MIILLEHDTRKHNGRRFSWKPGYWKMIWKDGYMHRWAWGLWSISIYPEPGIKDFHDYISAGNTEWRKN